MKTKDLILISLFAAITVVLSFFTIPIGVVPISLQTFGVYLAGGILGKKNALFSILIYVLLGVIGLPVFSGSIKSGPAAIIGPSGGFIIGFIIAAFVIGYIVDLGYNKHSNKSSKYFFISFGMIIGTLIIYILGVAQLIHYLKIDFLKAISLGVTPFLIGDGLKIVIAVIVSNIIRIQLKKEKLYIL